MAQWLQKAKLALLLDEGLKSKCVIGSDENQMRSKETSSISSEDYQSREGMGSDVQGPYRVKRVFCPVLGRQDQVVKKLTRKQKGKLVMHQSRITS